jgi:cytochrome c oxidase subunit 3/cytochrome o ubiquinol oxidase subunit 3
MTHAAEVGDSHPEGLLHPLKVGMLTFLASEVAFFGTLLMTYVYFLRQTTQETPNPSQVFRWPLVLISSACLFASSVTVHLAVHALHHPTRRRFLTWWGLTIVLGALFLVGTGLEWADLISVWGLTMSRNLFGSTYFTLVGFHAMHVTVGVILLSIVFGLAWRGLITIHNRVSVEVVSWYWHFVDGVWALVFTLVYIIGR